MTYDLRIYWVEDTPVWAESVKNLLTYPLQDTGVMVNFISESNTDTAKAEIANSCNGFKKYDLFFIDYNISSDIDGKDIINSLRSNNVDVDILFYSADREKEIRSIIASNLTDFEGVYVANRDTFPDKALSLIEKNARKLLSIQNIRGKLMDTTSENDFIIKSYIIEKYKNLNPEQKNAVCNTVRDYLRVHVEPNSEKIKNTCKEIDESGITKIKDFMSLPSYIVPLELKYLLFKEIAKQYGENTVRYDGYFNSVVQKRNVLAHKKLDICNNLDHIKYCDTLSQFKSRVCSQKCDRCNESFSISLEDWKQIRKQANVFSLVFEDILNKL